MDESNDINATLSILKWSLNHLLEIGNFTPVTADRLRAVLSEVTNLEASITE